MHSAHNFKTKREAYREYDYAYEIHANFTDSFGLVENFFSLLVLYFTEAHARNIVVYEGRYA